MPLKLYQKTLLKAKAYRTQAVRAQAQLRGLTAKVIKLSKVREDLACSGLLFCRLSSQLHGHATGRGCLGLPSAWKPGQECSTSSNFKTQRPELK